MRRAAKVDANQKAIVERLRDCSVTVEIVGKPLDLLVCCRGETSLMEVKTADGGFTKAQVEFIARWPGKIHVVRTEDEALEALGIV
jgi:hypothetical protein